MAGARNSGDWPEAWARWELGIINLKSFFFFFLWVRELFVLLRMVGRTWKGALTPGYVELCNFPSHSICVLKKKDKRGILVCQEFSRAGYWSG